MDKIYDDIVNRYKSKENRLRNSIVAFISGGVIGLLGEFLVNFYRSQFNLSFSNSSTMMLLTFIFFSCLFTSLGFFDNLVNYCRCGLIIPITGFAHSVSSCLLEFKKDGFIQGSGSNAFKLAGSVILYGVISTFVFGIIRYIIVYGV